ncbi:YeiH family protein [Flavitalea antarctica]
MVQLEKRFGIHEDWAVVIAGFLVIFLALAGVQAPVPQYNWSNPDDLFSKVFSTGNIKLIAWQFLLVLSISMVLVILTGKPVRSFLVILPVLYLLAIVALVVAGNKSIKSFNLEAVIFSLLFGLVIGNLVRIPAWFRESLNGELFVKIGLVLLGTSVIFSDVLKAGSLGLVQALVVVLSVWYFAFWVCKKLKVDDEMSMMLSSAVSICGVSAAIATSGAIRGDSKKLSYVISLVLITAIPMMIFMPVIANALGLSQMVTGAWLGGSIDTTGAVVASGSLVGETALKISTIVKFSQNVLLGLAAFAISLYWTYTRKTVNGLAAEKPTLRVIWERFPKFVLGFIGASLLFSFILSAGKVSAVKDSLKAIQGFWFVLAFVSIGLETNIKDLFKHQTRKPLYAFLTAQLFNILVTLLVAWLLFS